MLSLADFRAPTFSLSVTRDDVGLEDEFELFMLYWAPLSSCYVARVGKHRRTSRVIDISIGTFGRLSAYAQSAAAPAMAIVPNVNWRIQNDSPADRILVSQISDKRRAQDFPYPAQQLPLPPDERGFHVALVRVGQPGNRWSLSMKCARFPWL